MNYCGIDLANKTSAICIAAAGIVAVESLRELCRSVANPFMDNAIRRHGGRRTVGAKGISCLVSALITK